MVHLSRPGGVTFGVIRDQHLAEGRPEFGFHFVIDTEGKLLMDELREDYPEAKKVNYVCREPT